MNCGGVDRTIYEDAQLPSGVILRQSDRNVTQYGVKLRAGYEVSPGIKPFVDVLADTRTYDQRIDDFGFRRSSDGLGVKAGSTFEITRTLTGEASAGIQTRRYDDLRLKDSARAADRRCAHLVRDATDHRAPARP